MQTDFLQQNILRTLLYYDIFDYPLKDEEVFKFLPENSISQTDFKNQLKTICHEPDSVIREHNGYVFLEPKKNLVSQRLEREYISFRKWKTAKRVTTLIKNFPFVRAVFISGSLSKNNSDKKADLDFMLITAPSRLWICRSLLMLFKKTFLFNSYKYFCINYLITEDNLEIEEKNIFTATEIAYIKSTYNSGLMNKFIASNLWIKNYFPNYTEGDETLHGTPVKISNCSCFLRKILEVPFKGKFGDWLETKLLHQTVRHWKKKYSHISDEEREQMFKSTMKESKTHPHNMQKKILEMYNEKLKQFNLG